MHSVLRTGKSKVTLHITCLSYSVTLGGERQTDRQRERETERANPVSDYLVVELLLGKNLIKNVNL